jgi:hypothetical protein
MMLRFLRLIAAGLALGFALGAAAQAPLVLNPVQAAYLQAENRRVEEVFIQNLISTTGASRDQVLHAIPAKGRITDRLARIFNALERDLNAPLSDEQKGRIYTAEEERKAALKEALKAATAR